jgi:Kef-type K+ transport system membrane component KefB
MGYATAVAFGSNTTEALFVGLALSATSVSISAQTLMELNVLRSRVGLAMLGAAVFDDILVILLLSIACIFALGDSAESGSVAVTIVRMIGYFIGASVLGYLFMPRLANWISKLRVFQGSIAFSLALVLFYAWSAEAIGGIASITGAFLIGLLLAQTLLKNDIEQGITAMAYGFFVPIFFVNIGLGVDLAAISGSAWIFAIVLTIVAIISKIVGCGFGGRLGGLNNKESLQLGIGMVSRGEVGLIVAAFAVTEGLLGQNAFSITVFMVVIATLVTPPTLRAAFRQEPPEEQA